MPILVPNSLRGPTEQPANSAVNFGRSGAEPSTDRGATWPHDPATTTGPRISFALAIRPLPTRSEPGPVVRPRPAQLATPPIGVGPDNERSTPLR